MTVAVETKGPKDQGTKRPKSRRLSTKQLERMGRNILKDECALRGAVKEGDYGLEVASRKLTEAWKELNTLVERRTWDEAVRRDSRLPHGERVMFTLIFPAASWLDRNEVIVRTANTQVWDHGFFTIKEPSNNVASPGNWLTDLDYHWHKKYKPSFDLEKFREHARKVDESYRRWMGKGGPEAETTKYTDHAEREAA